jgi:hypothetical protein
MKEDTLTLNTSSMAKKQPEPEPLKIDVSKLTSVKNWASSYGEEKSGVPFSASYAYKLFAEKSKTPTALEVKQQYALVTIDGVNFVTERKNLPKQFR